MDMRGLGFDEEELQQFMERQANVIGDPGNEYGSCGRGFYRLQIAAQEKTIRQMLEQMKKAYERGGFGK